MGDPGAYHPTPQPTSASKVPLPEPHAEDDSASVLDAETPPALVSPEEASEKAPTASVTPEAKANANAQAQIPVWAQAKNENAALSAGSLASCPYESTIEQFC